VARPDPSKLSSETKQRLADELRALKEFYEPRAWEKMARNKQLPPDHPLHHLPWKHPRTGKTYTCGCDGIDNDWTKWIFLAGRGTGKTMAGSQWTLAMAMSEPGIYVAVCAPTFANVRATCFEDLQSGILANAAPGEVVEYNRNNLELKLRNGSVIRGFSAENTDSVRGQNLSYCWFDELAMIKYTKFFHYGLMPALRTRPKNNPPRVMITTTPSSLRLVRDLVEQAETDPKIHITAAVSEENPYFAEDALADLRRQYKGTYLEQQELEGKLVLGSDGALFTIENFCEYRIHPGDEPEFRRIVVAIDPATTTSDTSDESGIVVAAEGVDHHFYTLEDCSRAGSRRTCAGSRRCRRG
jgi:phage terminase large subunit-like protein